MVDVYKVLQPEKYLREFISRNIRPDGRTFEQCKSALVHPKAISTADGSCMVVLGDTKVCCGIKAEITTPAALAPETGFVVTNLELPALCSPIFKPGPPSDLAQSVNQLVSDIFNDAKVIDLNKLCIVKDKLVWVVHCDLICVNYGGSIVDASIMALIAALKTATLPKVEYDETSGNCIIHEEQRIPLEINTFPVATSFTFFESKTLLANPTHEEEQLCGGPLGSTVIVWGTTADEKEDLMLGMHQLGATPLSSETIQKTCDIAKKRSKQIRNLVCTALKS